MGEWLQSDLASWIAVVLAGTAAMLAWKALRRISYIEFDPDWTIQIQNNQVTVQGKVTVESVSSRWEWEGTVTIEAKKIPLVLKRHAVEYGIANMSEITLTGEYNGFLRKQTNAILRLKVKLGDGKSKRFKTRIHLLPTLGKENTGTI